MTEILFGSWRKSSRSADEANCIELANVGAVRDSKNPAAGMLRADLGELVAAIKTGRIVR